MKALKILWGLLVDDVRLVSILLAALILAYAASISGYKLLAAAIIWLGLIVSLWVSTTHELRLKLRS